MIISDRLHDEATAGGGFFDETAYTCLRITHKETRARAWIWTPQPR